MKKNHFYHFVLVFLLCHSVALSAFAQSTRLIKVIVPGLPVFECLHATGPALAVNNLKTNSKRTEIGTVTLVKNFDKLDDQLGQIKSVGKHFPSVIIEYYRKSPKGDLAKYGSIKLNDAFVSSVRVTENKQTEIKFTYRSIEWTWTDGGVTAADDWDVPAE